MHTISVEVKPKIKKLKHGTVGRSETSKVEYKRKIGQIKFEIHVNIYRSYKIFLLQNFRVKENKKFNNLSGRSL